MIRYPLEKWMRFALAGIAFGAALLLTPRAFLDVTADEPADAYQIPVDMLEPTDDCIWCSTPPAEFEEIECDDIDHNWLDDGRVDASDFVSQCIEEDRSIEPSA